MTKKEWFKHWFDSPYYHILYKNRDDMEAKNFISNLVGNINVDSISSALDLGCGKGRHAVELKKYFKNVIGIDLSANSISIAKTYESNGLAFHVDDMRSFKSTMKFDSIFNLFTSFGYFEKPQENIEVLKSCNKALKDNGIIIIDFLNAVKIQKNIIESEIKKVQGITFDINRKIEQGKIIKTISFKHKGISYNFEEKVQLFNKNDFENMFNKTQFKLQKVMGDYQLNPFNENSSDRLILIGGKI